MTRQLTLKLVAVVITIRFNSFRQKVIRSEVRRRWLDKELPTFRRMDTSNNEELNLFVDELMKINVLAQLGRELIRKKVILIVRERRKYVKNVSFLYLAFSSTSTTNDKVLAIKSQNNLSHFLWSIFEYTSLKFIFIVLLFS